MVRDVGDAPGQKKKTDEDVFVNVTRVAYIVRSSLRYVPGVTEV